MEADASVLAALGDSDTAWAAGGLDSLRPFVAFISTLTGSVSCLDLVAALRLGAVVPLGVAGVALLTDVLVAAPLLVALAALAALGAVGALGALGATLKCSPRARCAAPELFAEAASAAVRVGRADGRSEGRLAGGLEELDDNAEELLATEDFLGPF